MVQVLETPASRRESLERFVHPFFDHRHYLHLHSVEASVRLGVKERAIVSIAGPSETLDRREKK